MMRWILLGIGLILSLTGVIWMLQGINQLGGSPMTGHPFWAWAGLVALAAGLVMLYAGVHSRRVGETHYLIPVCLNGGSGRYIHPTN